MSHATTYLKEAERICGQIDRPSIELMAGELVDLRTRNGRLFIIGLGGSAANASHAANDFVSLCGINAICLSDNTAELTATMNDHGWANAYAQMLANRKANPNDLLMVLSVGGGTPSVSVPLMRAVDHAKRLSVGVLGIVGRDGGFVKKYGDSVIMVPNVNPNRVTPHTEAFQSVILHLLCSHPDLQRTKTTW